MKIFILLFAGILIGASIPLTAEESSGQPVQATEKPEQAGSEKSEKEQQTDTQQVKAQPAVSSQAGSTKKIRAKNAGNVDNYEASEEISEDLSVSYPVDI